MEDIIPDSVLTRKKLGFMVPISHWLRNELSDWAYSFIIESDTDYLFYKVYLLTLLDDHQKEKWIISESCGLLFLLLSGTKFMSRRDIILTKIKFRTEKNLS
jgi:asparagine synthetase B (glutamine-hydrolysing)